MSLQKYKKFWANAILLPGKILQGSWFSQNFRDSASKGLVFKLWDLHHWGFVLKYNCEEKALGIIIQQN